MNRFVILAALCGTMVAISTIGFAQQKHKMSDIMKKGFKADDGPFKKATKGKATADEAKLLHSYAQSMATFKPEKGDAAAWKVKTDAFLEATKALVAGDKTATAKLKKAGNCKACHKDHKPKK